MRTRALAPIVWAAFALVLSVLLLSPSVLAATTTFTSTADFDAGTKTPVADGNLGIETATDNLGIASGGFELGSLKGDSFTTADADANTAKWQLYQTGAPTALDRQVVGGQLRLNVNSGANMVGVATEQNVSGNWDARIRLDITGTNGQYEYFATNEVARCGSGSAALDGFGFIITTTTLQTFKCVNNVLSDVGGSIVLPSDPIYVRVTRSSDTFTTLTSPDGSSWTQREQSIDALILNPMFFAVWNGQGTLANSDYDDFHLAAGTPAAGSFRVAGTWTSATQAAGTDLINQVVVSFSGVSASNFITSVAVLDSAGAERWVDNTDVTTGTSQTYTPPSVSKAGGWRFRLNLTGGTQGRRR